MIPMEELAVTAGRFNWQILRELKIRDGCCAYCGVRMVTTPNSERQFTIDHVIAKSNGGDNSASNRLPCCKRCNYMKGSNSLDYFLGQVQVWIAITDRRPGHKSANKRWKHTAFHIVSIQKYFK